MKVEQLKAMAYDHMVEISKYNESLRAINNEIAVRAALPAKTEESVPTTDVPKE